MYHHLFLHSTVVRHLNCSEFGAIVNSAALKILDMSFGAMWTHFY